METLVELVARIKADATQLEQGLKGAEKQTEASSKKMQESLRKVGMVMAASGAAITAALGLMGKAAIDEDINIKRLATTINNSGTAYDSVKDSLEALIATTQRKTGIADNEQRDILGRLILVTQDYGKAIELLPTVLDLAAAGEMDATTAATYLGKAYLELEEGAEEVSVRFGQASLQFKNMEDIQNRVAGSAKNLANPLSVLKASVGDVAEEIGMNLIPLVKDATNRIVDIAIKIQEWIKEHPVLAKVLTLVSLSLGAVLTVVGGLILVIPILVAQWTAFHAIVNLATIASFAHAIALKAVTAAQWLWNIALSANPIGLVIIAIGALIAAGILLWKNWDKVTAFFGKAWQNIKIVFLTGIKVILDGLVKFAGWLPGIGNKIEQLRDKVANMLEAEQVKKDAAEIKRTAEELTKSVKAEFEKQALEIQSSFDKQKQAAQSAYDTAVKAINKEYGIGEAAKNVSETRIEAAKRATEEARQSYAREKDAAKDRYDTEMAEIRAIYSAKMEALNLETDATVKALQDQIDAIDAQTEAEDLALQRQEEAKKLATLSGKEREEFAAEIARRELLRSRSAEKNALRERIAEAQEQANKRKDQIQSETDAELASLKIRYEANIKNIDMLSERLDGDLKETLARIEQDRIAKIDAEKEKLNAEIARLEKAEQEEVKFYAAQLGRANQQVKDINVAYDSLEKRYDIEIVTHEITAETGRGVTIGPFTGTDEEWERRRVKGFAQGGIVPGPVGMPQVAMVHGGETIIPPKQGGIVPGPVGMPQVAMVHGGETIIPPKQGGIVSGSTGILQSTAEVPEFQRGGIVPSPVGMSQLAEVKTDTRRDVTIGPFTGTKEEWERRRIEGFAQGGIVPGPIGQPQLAMVHGGEAIIPNDELWGGIININIDSFTANSTRDVDMLAEKIVKLIRIRTGLKT